MPVALLGLTTALSCSSTGVDSFSSTFPGLGRVGYFFTGWRCCKLAENFLSVFFLFFSEDFFAGLMTLNLRVIHVPLNRLFILLSVFGQHCIPVFTGRLPCIAKNFVPVEVMRQLKLAVENSQRFCGKLSRTELLTKRTFGKLTGRHCRL